MRVAQPDDVVTVHYVVQLEDGSTSSSRGPNRAPLRLTVGVDHPRLPGLGSTLVGLASGDRLTVQVPAGRAYGLSDRARAHRGAPALSSDRAMLNCGFWTLRRDSRGRRHLVRTEAGRDRVVVFDANRRWAEQVLRFEIEVLSVERAGADRRESHPGPRLLAVGDPSPELPSVACRVAAPGLGSTRLALWHDPSEGGGFNGHPV